MGADPEEKDGDLAFIEDGREITKKQRVEPMEEDIKNTPQNIVLCNTNGGCWHA